MASNYQTEAALVSSGIGGDRKADGSFKSGKQRVTEALSRLEPHVRRLQKEFRLAKRPSFTSMLKTEWATIEEPDLSISTIKRDEINALYELRSELLDWETETGFLGFFTSNPGYRYNFTRRLEILFDMLPPAGILKNARVGEMGTAAGIVANSLAPYVKEYFGTDVTPTALKFAKALSDKLGYVNTHYQVADGHKLPFADNSLDVIVSTETYEHLVNPVEGLREMYRSLKPGGVVVFTTPTAPTLSDLFMKTLQIFKRDLHVEDTAQFDKKAYFAARRAKKNVPDTVFKRVHYRFGYNNLVKDFESVGFEVRKSKGAIFGFPPYYLATYQIIPSWLLAVVRQFEELLNELGIFARWGAVSTGFQLVKKEK